MPHTPLVLGLDVPNLLPESVFGANLDWARPAGRLIWSTLIVAVGFAVIFAWTRRPKSREPVTWAGAMAGAVAVFALMIVAFATWPHEWITFANSYLNWGRDSFVARQNRVLPFNVTKSVVTDTIEVLIYGIGVAATVFLAVQWQKRPARDETEAGEEAVPTSRAGRWRRRVLRRTSAYGRPVTAG